LRVILYVKENCGLCEETEEILRRARKAIPFEPELVYIDDNPALLSRYEDRVPVVVIGDQEVASAPVDETRLIAALSSYA
jgi:glutaredoxin